VPAKFKNHRKKKGTANSTLGPRAQRKAIPPEGCVRQQYGVGKDEGGGMVEPVLNPKRDHLN